MSIKIKYGLSKFFLLALSLLVLESVFLSSFAADITAKHIDTPITIDGILNEPAWDTTDFTTFATHPAKNDSTTALVKLLWDKDFLYAAYDVKDEYVETSSEEWNDDSVSCTLKNNLMLSKNRQDLRGTGEGTSFRALLPKPGTMPDNNSNIDTGFWVEMKIAWASVGFTPQLGSAINIDFLSVDHNNNPGGSYVASSTNFSKLSWDGDDNPDTALGVLYLDGIDLPPPGLEKSPHTYEVCDFYGFDPSLKEGDSVILKDKAGNELGFGIVGVEGQFGFITAEGDKLNTPGDEGFREGEYVYVFVNGTQMPYVGLWQKGGTIRLDSTLNANSAPFFYIIDDKIAPRNSLLQFVVLAYDLDVDSLYYRVENMPEGAVFDSGIHIFRWAPTNFQYGTYQVYFEVTDNINQPVGGYVNITVPSGEDFISFEAEDISDLSHPITYDTSIGAWAGACITSQSSNITSHVLYIPRDGYYTIWLRMNSESDLSDAVAMNIDNDFDIIVEDELGNDSLAFKWINFEGGNPDNKIILHLTQGKHTLYLKDIEPNTKIDSVIITNNLSFIPPDNPPSINTSDWTQVVSDGFGDAKNHEAKLADYNGSLYASTSNTNLHPAIYKSDDGINFTKAFEYTAPTVYPPNPKAYIMYRTLDLKYLDIGANSGLYAITDDWYGSCYITKLNSDGTFITNCLGRRDWWAKNIISFKDETYAGFYNDWNLYFTMRRTQDPMTKTTWQNSSLPAFGKDAQGKTYANMSAESSAVFKGYLYIGTYNRGYFGRTTTGAQIWRTADGTTWEPCVLNGFGSASRSSISHMTVFGGYLYATTSEAFGPNYVYRSKDGLIWEQAFSGLSSEPYIGDLTSYMGRLYLTTYNWGGRVYSSLNGKTWIAVSNPYINNDSKNSLVGDLHVFKGHLYVNTRNMTSGTQFWRAKMK